MKITEAQLRKIIKESIQGILRENEMGVYTMEDWTADGTFGASEGQEVDAEVVMELRDCVPPETMTRDCLQVGEAYDHDRNTGEALYATFKKQGERWFFTGYRPSIKVGWK